MEVFVGIGVTGIVGVGAAVGVAVLEGVGALVQAQDASNTDTASANARGFHCAEPRISSISQINRFV